MHHPWEKLRAVTGRIPVLVNSLAVGVPISAVAMVDQATPSFGIKPKQWLHIIAGSGWVYPADAGAQNQLIPTFAQLELYAVTAGGGTLVHVFEGGFYPFVQGANPDALPTLLISSPGVGVTDAFFRSDDFVAVAGAGACDFQFAFKSAIYNRSAGSVANAKCAVSVLYELMQEE